MIQPTALRIEGAAKRYGMNPALCGVDLQVRQGEWLGLVGPNGAGKTTLTGCIAGLVGPDEGRIELFGRPQKALGRSPERRSLGLVPQEIALYPLLTASENLIAFGELHGLPRAEARDRAEHALGWTGLAGRDREPVRTFSTGMMRRLNIACGVLHRPRLLLLDEPTVGVDPRSRQSIAEMLESLRQEGTALLETSHQLTDLEARCDRIAVMDQGQVIAVGTLRELAERTPLGARVVRLRLDRPATRCLGEGWELSGETLRGTLRDVGVELPEILERLRVSGAVVEDLQVGPPSLEEVFRHLTGREADA